MAEPFATIDDLEKRWRPLTTAERPRADTLLEDASAQLRVECRDLDARLTITPPATVPDLDPAVPRRVVCAMVKRAMLAPVDQGAVTAEQQTAGPFSQSLTFSNPNGDLYLTKAERKLLGCDGQKAFMIDTAPRRRYGDRPWLVITEPLR